MTASVSLSLLIRRIAVFALVVGIWFAPVPAGLTSPAWHLFAIFAGAIVSVLLGAFPLLTSSMLAVSAVVLTGTVEVTKAFSGFAACCWWSWPSWSPRR
jgi:DASS family divalent anion:Na+ symporter